MRLALLFLAAGGVLSATEPLSPAQAETFHQKLLLIVHHSTLETSEPRRTMVTEPEVNSYLRYRIAHALPVGVTEPAVTLMGNRRVRGRAIVDLDAVRQKQSSGGWFDPKAYLAGKLPVTATGTLITKDGSGQLQLESAEVSGVPIPKPLLQEIVSYYTRSETHPRGISLDQPFPLPANIRQIEVETGRAVVIQ